MQQGSIYRFQLLDAYILDSVTTYNLPRSYINNFIARQQPFNTYDKSKWNEFLNFAAARGSGLKRIIAISYVPALENARKVVALLKKQYHLETKQYGSTQTPTSRNTQKEMGRIFAGILYAFSYSFIMLLSIIIIS